MHHDHLQKQFLDKVFRNLFRFSLTIFLILKNIVKDITKKIDKKEEYQSLITHLPTSPYPNSYN